MNTLNVSRWLWDFYLLSTLLLLAVVVVGIVVKQPARRNALAWATAVSLLALACLTTLPNWSRLHLSFPTPSASEWTADLQPVFAQAIQQTPVVAPALSQELPPNAFPAATQILVIDWGVMSLYTLAIGSSVVLCWLALGAWQVRRLRSSAAPPPFEILRFFDQLVPAPESNIQLGVLAKLPVAVAVGLQRPAILLPQTLVAEANPQQLRSVLAHEIAHLAHRDLWLLALLRALMVLLWPHPLFWLFRRRVRLDQEILADAAAAQLTSRGEYAEQLVALARNAVPIRVPRLASSVGLWEKPSQLKQRIALLLDEKLTILRNCSRRWRVGTFVSLVGIAVGLSLVTLTPAETEESQAAEKAITTGEEPGKPTNADFHTMEVRITDEEGHPLTGAKLYVAVWYTKGYLGEKIPKEYFADSQGMVNLKLPRRLHILRLWPSKSGYVPEFTNFTEGSHEEGRLIPDRYEFKLAKGTTLGGIIVDENGVPVSGVKVDVSVQVDEPVWGANPEPMISAGLTDQDFNEGSAITDKDGKWQIDDAPAQTEEKVFEFRLKIIHPEFASDANFGELQSKQQITTAMLRDRTAKIILSRGKRVRGVVVDSSGKPVTNGYVVWGNNPYSGDAKKFETRLDEAGGFMTSPLPQGEHAFTVIAPAFMPGHRRVNVESSMTDLRFELKPGKRLMVKVVDGKGMPIPHAYFHVGSWSGVEEEFNGGQNSILHARIPQNAGQDGIYVWDGAPANGVTFQISARDFASKTVTLAAIEGEHVVELSPALIVFGKVTDAKTGRPIETFNAVPLLLSDLGLISSTWQYGTVTGENGHYEIRLDGISDYTKDYKLRFEAKGYHSLFSEKTFNLGEGRVEYNVSLTPAETEQETSEAVEPTKNELSGQVVDESGNPLAGVMVDAWTWHPGNETTTDAEGHFALRGFEDSDLKGIEIQFAKEGFCPAYFVSQPAGASDWIIKLNNRTFLEGRVTNPEGKPVVHQRVRASRGPFKKPGMVIGEVWTETETDTAGQYRLYLEPDVYNVQIHVPQVGLARHERTVLQEGDQRKFDMQLKQGPLFRAKIVDSETGDPVEGFRLWSWMQKGIEGVSDSDGMLVIDNMLPGQFEFSVGTPPRYDLAGDYGRWWSPQAADQFGRKDETTGPEFQRNIDELKFVIVENMEPVTIYVEKAANIRGKVVDPKGKPVAGVTVAPARTGTGNSLTGDTRYGVRTDVEGAFLMRLPASRTAKYHLVAHDGDYQEWRTWANGIGEPLQTKPGETIENIVLELSEPCIVRGIVVDQNGDPVVGGEVKAESVDKLDNRYYQPTTKTNAKGEFELRHIRPGKHRLNVNNNAVNQSLEVHAQPGKPVNGVKLSLVQSELNRLFGLAISSDVEAHIQKQAETARGSSDNARPAAAIDTQHDSQEPNTIRGICVDENSLPLPGVKVEVYAASLHGPIIGPRHIESIVSGDIQTRP